MEIKLFKSIMIDGKETKIISPDFENMATGTSARAIKFLATRGYTPALADTDVEYNAMVAAMAAGLAPEDAWALHDKDKRRLAREAMNFFLVDSEES